MTRVRFGLLLFFFLLFVAAVAACSGSSASDGASSGSGGLPDGGTASGGPPIGDGQPGPDTSRPTGPSGLPCAVDKVLATYCQTCHSAPTQFGAPMPLVTWADLNAPAVSNPAKKVYELVAVRIHDDAKPMPQSPNPRLSAADTATLDQWIAAGAPQSTDNCQTPPPDAGLPPLSCTPDEHMKPAAAFAMPQGTADEYVCYTFDVARNAKRHVVGMTPYIGNTKIVHHMLLFQSPTAVTNLSGTPSPCASGGGQQWRIIYGWAPGGLPMEMPKEAGFPEDPGTTHYIVQIHYNNINGLQGQTDTSGFDLCTTDQLRPNDADVIAFGTLNISIPPHATVDTTCSVSVQQTFDKATVFASMPHMHKLGTVIDTNAFTGGSATGTSLGKKNPFNFQAQSWVPVTATLHGGDTIKTRCAWNNTTDQTVTFGENTENEMCFSFTMYYPRVTLPSWMAPAAISTCSPTP